MPSIFLSHQDPFLILVLFFSIFMSCFFILTFLKHKHRIGNPKVKKFRKVSILIAAYNEEEGIADTIRNALAIDWPKNKLEIIVVENNQSTDNTLKIAKSFEKRGVRVFSLKEGGKGNALNYALKRATGEIIVTMDADTYARPDVLKKMLGYFDDPEVMAASPAIVTLKPKTFAQKVQNVEYLFGVFLRKIFHFLGAVYVTPGAFTAYRKTFFDKHGGYDTTNITEDFEMCLRIQSKGYKVTNSINALVFTISPKTFRALHKQRLRWFLGFIETSLQYRQLFFTNQRGILSSLIMPTAVISIAFTLVLFSKAIYSFGMDILNLVSKYNAARSLDLTSWIYNIKLDLFYLRLDVVMLATAFLIILGLFMFLAARRYSGDKDTFAIGYLIYILFYIIIFSLWWMHAVYFKLFGRKLRFGGVEWNNSVLTKLTSRV